MSGRIENTLRDYLEQAGQLRPIQLGGESAVETPVPRAVDPEGEALFVYFQRRIASFNAYLALLTAISALLVPLAVLAAARAAGKPPILAAAVLATVSVQLLLVTLIRRLLAEKVAMGLITGTMRDLPPDETVRLIESIYWNRLWKPGKRTASNLPSPQGRRPAIEYEDFDVTLRPSRGEGPAVIEARSSVGANEDVLALSSDLVRQTGELTAMLQHCPTRHLVPMDLPVGIDVRSMGLSLFGALFPGGIQPLFYQAYGRTGTIAGHGLRIRVTYNPGHREIAWLGALPWEILATQTENYLGRRRLISIIHTLEVPRPVEPPVRSSQLRILAVSSLPEGASPLDLETELRELEVVWEQQPEVSVTSLRPPTLEALNDRLSDQEIHVLHYMGHGGIEPHGGVLYFEDDAVTGPQLADAIEDVRSLRLVVINACLSASSGPVDVDPSGELVSPSFAGLATCLVQAGATAVVAMQFAISDAAAIAFSRALYRRLAVGDTLDTAVTEGRRTLARRFPESLEWASPVLFLRSGDSRIFVPSET